MSEEKKPVLLTVSGVIPPDVGAKVKNKERPNPDYIAMADIFNADLIDYKLARKNTGWFGKILEWLFGPQFTLAWACFLLRNQYQLIFTDGEQIGIPLAFLLKFLSFKHRPRHLMIGHILSVWKKEIVFDLFKIQSSIDYIFVYSTYQKQYIQKRWNIASQKVVFTPFMVDHHFFCQENTTKEEFYPYTKNQHPIICSVGLEFRDYATLIEAVKGLDVIVIIAAASPWSKRKSNIKKQSIPENIIIQRFSQYDLRNLYAASEFVVMPLHPVKFQAGVTAILEAMSMSKAVICSRTPGQTDVIRDGLNGIYVPPKNPLALREAIQSLLDQPEKARKLGEAGRQTILDCMNLEKYSQFLNTFVQQSIQPAE